MGEASGRNGVGIVLSPAMKESVLKVNRVSSRLIWMTLNVDGYPLKVISAYAPQMGCNDMEKDEFWGLLENARILLMQMPANEALWIGADLNGHVGEGNSEEEDVMGRHGLGLRSASGERTVQLATANRLAIVNTYFKKRITRRAIYTSGGLHTQVDYIMCRRQQLQRI